jgi:hypothetical protein
MFDKNGMLILRKQSELPKDDIAKKYAKHGSNFQKVLECLSQYNVGDKFRVNDIRKKVQLNSMTYVLIILKREGYIDYEKPGSGRTSYLTILRKTKDIKKAF